MIESGSYVELVSDGLRIRDDGEFLLDLARIAFFDAIPNFEPSGITPAKITRLSKTSEVQLAWNPNGFTNFEVDQRSPSSFFPHHILEPEKGAHTSHSAYAVFDNSGQHSLFYDGSLGALPEELAEKYQFEHIFNADSMVYPGESIEAIPEGLNGVLREIILWRHLGPRLFGSSWGKETCMAAVKKGIEARKAKDSASSVTEIVGLVMDDYTSRT